MMVTTQAGESVQCQCPQCISQREKAKGLSAIWGIITTEPKPEPIAPPPINWLTHQKPLTDTVAERAAFLKKQGLTCPTEIMPDDIEDIARGCIR